MDHDHQFVTVFCSHCGHVLTVPVYCRNRFCPVCNTTRQTRLKSKLTEFIRMNRITYPFGYKHLTLTIRNQNDLKKMVVMLLKSFRRLRQRGLWKDHVKGGAFVVEITRKKHEWHAHLHIIIEAKFIEYEDLVDAWNAVSTGRGVYIQRIPSGEIVRYLLKYITKSELNVDHQRMASEALKGSRLFQPFGSWHNPIQAIKPQRFPCPNCERDSWVYGTFDAFFRSCSPECISDFPTTIKRSRASPNNQLEFIPKQSLDNCIRQ